MKLSENVQNQGCLVEGEDNARCIVQDVKAGGRKEKKGQVFKKQILRRKDELIKGC